MKEDVFYQTSIQHINLPSVIKIENYAFSGSKLRTLIIDNCENINKNAFVNVDNNLA